MWQMMAKRVPDHMIAVSEAIGDAWGEMGEIESENETAEETRWGRWRGRWGQAEAPPITVVRNGVNLDRFKPRERTHWIHDRLGVPHQHRIIGMPAVFARWKGQLEVIEAFSQICDDFPDTHLVIIGGSIYDTTAEREYGEELLKTTGEWGLARGTALGSGEWGPISELTGEESGTPPSWRDAGKRDPDAERVPAEAARLQRVHLLPFQREIELAYPDFELAVHYSLRPEPFGRVVLEAMACGVPIIAAAEGGPLEIVGDGIGPRREAGWLAEPRDPEALARVMASALSLPSEVLQSVGAAGRRRAEDEFSSRHFAAGVAEVLRGVGGTSSTS
jgi:glycosyltransferase involved in cell wall biosynthesis